jgi:VIT1/CCC1 family predicted Fe2+/Mn2+ transporter
MFKKFILKKLIWLLVIALLVWLFPTVMKYIAIISGLIIYFVIGFVITLLNDDELSEKFAENSVMMTVVYILSVILWPLFVAWIFLRPLFNFKHITKDNDYGTEENG